MKLLKSLFLLCLVATSISTYGEVINISAKDTSKLIAELEKSGKEFQILDVRTQGEFHSGHIKDSLNVDYYSSNFKDVLQKQDKNKLYIVYCRSGNRSLKSSLIMSQMGFDNKIYNLQGGIKSWILNNFPIY